ncbi:hypothetical protein C942_02000 [Photobacterium marinum]|uniref:Uncharacterized protein n=1 Tax=Photobacterium marinum TaxID=1056511 RepID=L8J7S0_9GAMM|nr:MULTISPECIES: hypothetical protein [Photobacterium]ELR64910.1 hypothetical protein C942_02000 [Photobacterium marinum]
MDNNTETLRDAIGTIYSTFPKLNYTPHPDDLKLLAAYMKSTESEYPKSLDLLLSVNNADIELELIKYKRF